MPGARGTDTPWAADGEAAIFLPYIYGEKQGTGLLDLDPMLPRLSDACPRARTTGGRGPWWDHRAQQQDRGRAAASR